MKLTNTIRDAFIRAAMNDVPSVDYAEQIRKIAYDDLVSQLPPAVAKVWNDPKLRDYIKTDYNSYGGVSVTHPSKERVYKGPPLGAAAQAAVDELKAKNTEQGDKRKDLEYKLKAAAYGCTTRKQMVELLNEFEKYLPAYEAKAIKSNLPAVANLVADFTKAA
jgi:hypothetical protein